MHAFDFIMVLFSFVYAAAVTHVSLAFRFPSHTVAVLRSSIR